MSKYLLLYQGKELDYVEANNYKEAVDFFINNIISIEKVEEE